MESDATVAPEVSTPDDDLDMDVLDSLWDDVLDEVDVEGEK